MSNQFRFEECPPPAQAPVDSVAAALGLCNGLRADKRNHQFRCAECGRMQQRDSWIVWVPDSVQRDDPAWSVTEDCRLNACNGSGSGWCLACARSLGAPPLSVAKVGGIVSRIRGLFG